MDDGLGGDADVAASPQDAAYRAAPAPRVLVSNVVGVLRLGYGLAARRLLVLLMPAAVLFVPASVICGGLIIAVVGRHGLIVNGDVHAVSVSPGLVVAVIAALVVLFTCYGMALAATVMMSAGLLLGRPVPPGAAVRAVCGRPVTFAAFGVMVGALGALALAAGVAAATGGPLTVGVAAFVVVLVSGWWLTLGVPVAVLERRGAWQSVNRAWSASRQRRTRQTIALTLGMLVGPGLFVAGVRWAMSPLEGVAHIVLVNAIITIASMITLVFQAGTLTVAALNQEYPHPNVNPWNPNTPEEKPGQPLDLVRVAELLPSTGSVPRRRRWAVLCLALLPLPGLLYGGYVWRNPLGLPTDHTVIEKASGRPVALRLLPGQRPIAIFPDLSARVCADPGCTDSRLYSGVHIGDLRDRSGSAVTLPDGTVAVAVWGPQHPGTGDDHEAPQALRLFRCGTSGCGGQPATQNAPVVARSDNDYLAFSHVAAMTVTGEGIVIAAVSPARYPDPNRSGGHILGHRMRLIRCADIRCTTPHTIVDIRLSGDVPGVSPESRPIAMAADQHGRPIVAYEDDEAIVNVIACDSAECRHPKITQTSLERHDIDPLDYELYMNGVDIAVPPDDRPVITYRDTRTGAARLLHCRTFDCTQASNTALSGPGPWQSRPALTLDRDGHPLIATYNHDMLTLVTCRDFGCDHRRSVALAKIENGPGFVDLTVDRDGRPLVLWKDGQLLSNTTLHLTTCARPRCGM